MLMRRRAKWPRAALPPDPVFFGTEGSGLEGDALGSNADYQRIESSAGASIQTRNEPR